jgi:uncharacterized protein DUF6920
MRRAIMVLGSTAAAGTMTWLAASRRWRVKTDTLALRVMESAVRPEARVRLASLSTTPELVRRYFRVALREGAPYVRTVRLVQMGEFRSKETEDTGAGWRYFEARQVVSANPPGFVWDARISFNPLGSVWARDSYISGSASLRAALFGLIPVASAADTPELRAGALQRYLAESVWLPSALLPSERLSWNAIDASHARATLTDGEVTASLDFEFSLGGEIVGVSTPSRARAAGRGRYTWLPWGGRYQRYEERGGMRVPLESEVYWVVDGKEQPYYRGRNIEVAYAD